MQTHWFQAATPDSALLDAALLRYFQPIRSMAGIAAKYCTGIS